MCFDPTATWVSQRRCTECSVSWTGMSSKSLPCSKGVDEMEERAGLSQPIKTFTCIICGLSNGPVLYYGECACVRVCVSKNGVQG